MISNSFDRYRSVEAIARITGNSIEDTILRDRTEALSYHFQSREAFMRLLQRRRYRLSEEGSGLNVYKYRRLVTRVTFTELDALIAGNFSIPAEENRIKNIITDAIKNHDRTAEPVYRTLSGDRRGRLSGYRSDLSDYLEEKFGIETVYLADESGAVRDYFIIDPARKQILGSSVLLAPEVFLGAETRAAEAQSFSYFPAEPAAGHVRQIFSGFNISISDDADDASLYHKKKNRNT
ncbi:MAG: hypothetical protein EOO01_31205 [Chitinophagaceae bacterium]|nr:MAG: hypothetical protein EOO01_31205 [Chitinophagaceae bacterium]